MVEILAADKAYHGNTLGALSVMGYEARKQPFRPLLPDVRYIKFNSEKDIETAAKVINRCMQKLQKMSYV